MRNDDIFSTIASPVRRKILDMLRQKPLAAGEIATFFDLNRPAVSEHLNVLREARLVVEETRGRHRIYHLNAAALAEVGEWLHPFEHYWRQRVDALVDFLDEEEKSGE